MYSCVLEGASQREVRQSLHSNYNSSTDSQTLHTTIYTYKNTLPTLHSADCYK